MDEIEKALRKLSDKERTMTRALLHRIQAGSFSGLDLKKLKGRDDIYRVRRGKFRIIFRKAGDRIFILTFERRSDTTYR